MTACSRPAARLRTPCRSAIAAVLVCAVTMPLGSQTVPARRPAIETFLTTRFGVTAAQLAALRRGEPVTTLLPGSVDREVIVAGAIRVNAPAERTVALVRDIERLESGAGFLQTKRLSDPPRLDDFAALEVTAEDLASLRRCRLGRCDIKLDRKAFETLAHIDWKSPDAPGRANLLVRQVAMGFVEAYRRGGNRELPIYGDRERPLSVAQEFADMVNRHSQLPDAVPELAAYLLDYPAVPRPRDADEFYYWSVAEFGLKPVFRLNQVAIYTPARAGSVRYAIATKQLYANHYFHSALELRELVDDETQPGRAHYLVVLNMARLDGLTGFFGGIIKSRVRSGSRDGLARVLRTTRMRAEAAGSP